MAIKDEESEIASSIMSIRVVQDTLSNLVRNSKFEIGDIRVAVFSTILQIMLSAKFSLGFLRRVEQGAIPLEVLEGMFGIQSTLGKLSVQQATYFLELFEKFTKFSMLVLVNFQIENYLKIILQKLTNTDAPDNFYRITDTLLKTVQVSDKERKLHVFNTFAMIRNSFHSNGVHTKNDFTITINNEIFEFKRGEKLEGITWNRTCVILNEIIKILIEINNLPIVQNITGKIENIYTPLVETNKGLP